MSVEIVMPAMEMAQDTGTLVAWLKPEGVFVKKGEPLLAIETDKVNVEIEAPASGILMHVRARAGDKVPVGQVIAELVPETATGSQPQPAQVSITPVAGRLAKELGIDPSKITPGGRRIEKADVLAFAGSQKNSTVPETASPRLCAASPLARRIAGTQQIDLAQVTGSGPLGAIRARDVQQRFAASALPASAVTPPVTPPAPPEYKSVPLAGIRKTIAERLQSSYQTAPHIALTIAVDMTEIRRLVEQVNGTVREQTGHALTLTGVLAKLVGSVLLQHPRLNAHLVEAEIREYSSVHMGIAVALDDGLIVPVIQHIERKGLAAIQAELTDLAARARAGKLTPAQVRGSTFTISNLGKFEIEQFTAILNPPEVAILAVGHIEDVPRNVDGQIVLRPILRLTLNADHRAVDGAVAAQFLQALKQRLERPYLEFA